MNDTYIVITASKDIAKNGKPYAKLLLKNEDGTLSLTVWEFHASINPGDICRVLSFKEKDGFKSTTSGQIVISEDKERKSSLQQFFPKPPTREKWNLVCTEIGDSLRSETWLNISTKLYNMYASCTAARSNHHAFVGGLAQHTMEMLMMAHALIHSKALPYHVNAEVVYYGILFHDFGKTMEYNQKDFSYKPQMFLHGHPYLSAKYMCKILDGQISDDKIQAIEHCILAHHMFKDWGAPVTPCNQEALLVATVDMLSGHGTQLANSENLDKFQETKVVHV